jgi:Ser/Thr protein kinase RdoA (MazF antagonist)
VDGEESLGGNLNDAVRIGDSVHRRAGPWTPSIHALLRYLERAGFPAPRVVGMDAQGREVLRYIPGEAHSGSREPVPDHVFAEAHLVAAARLLRRYHDVVADFRPPPNAHWRLIAPTAYEVVCHNDWSPWNALLRNGKLEVMLDWDLAGPGTRLWDVANAAYCWVPIGAASSVFADVAVRARRLGAFCDAYGLDDRSELLLAMRLRIEHVARFIDDEARAGDPGFMLLRSWQTSEKMRDDVAYLDANWKMLERAL